MHEKDALRHVSLANATCFSFYCAALLRVSPFIVLLCYASFRLVFAVLPGVCAVATNNQARIFPSVSSPRFPLSHVLLSSESVMTNAGRPSDRFWLRSYVNRWSGAEVLYLQVEYSTISRACTRLALSVGTCPSKPSTYRLPNMHCTSSTYCMCPLRLTSLRRAFTRWCMRAGFRGFGGPGIAKCRRRIGDACESGCLAVGPVEQLRCARRRAPAQC
jgi:hypothetical protein